MEVRENPDLSFLHMAGILARIIEHDVDAAGDQVEHRAALIADVVELDVGGSFKDEIK